MEVLQNQQWLLSLGTFLPLAGVLVMLFIPKREESLIKGTAVVTAAATLLVGVYTLMQFDYGQAEKQQFFTTNELDQPDQGDLHDRSRRHQPAAVLPVDGHHLAGDDLLVGPRPCARATPRRSSS